MKATDFFDLRRTLAERLFLKSEYPWDAIDMLWEYIYRVGRGLDSSLFREVRRGVWIARSASVSESAELFAPVIVGEGAGIGRLCRIGGSVIIGNGASVGNSSEVKSSVLFDGAVLSQNNYISDSILGCGASLGAGAIVASRRSDRRKIVLTLGKKEIECERKRFGAIVGDGAKVGAASVICAGSIVLPFSSVEPLTRVKGSLTERIASDMIL